MTVKNIFKRAGIAIGITVLTAGTILSQAGIANASEKDIKTKPFSITTEKEDAKDQSKIKATEKTTNETKETSYSTEEKVTSTEAITKAQKTQSEKNKADVKSKVPTKEETKADTKSKKYFNKKEGNINVDVTAPEGSLPDGTTMKIRPLTGSELENFKEDVARKSNKIVYSGQAVDISFYNKDGKEIEPEKEIDVKISLDNGLPKGEQVVAHKKDNGEVNIVENAKATQNTTYFKSKEFSVYGIVTASWVGDLQAYNDGENTHRYYELQYNGKRAFCMDWGKDMPDGASYTERDILDVISLEEAKNLCALLYKFRERVQNNDDYYSDQALIWSYYTGKRIYSDGIADPNSIFDCIDDFNMLNNAGKLDELKSNLHPVGTIATPNDGADYQRLISLDYVVTKTGSVTLKKESANPSVTKNSPCYSFENAEFTITKVDEPDRVYRLVTNGNGDAHVGNVPVGTYRVEETRTPKGFAKKENIPNIVVTEGQDTSFTVTDEPLLDPLPITIKKVNSKGKKVNPQGNGSLEGAEFEMKFYDRYFDNNNATGKATRTWVFKTDGNGRIITRDKYKVRGDALYKDPNGQDMIPLGTLLVKEIKAPTGYKINSTTYSGRIIEDNGVAKVEMPKLLGIGQNGFELNEDIIKGSLKLTKKDSNYNNVATGDSKLEGTEFNLINKSKNEVFYNGKMIKVGGVVTTLTMKYDAGAKAYVAKAGDLPFGSYVIKEKKAGEGYKLSSKEYKVEINSDKEVSIEASNEVQEGQIKVVKVDSATNKSEGQGAAKLDGIVFDVYNKSAHDIIYKGTSYKVGDKVTTLTTTWNEADKEYNAYTEKLPYGTYEVVEVATNKSYNMAVASNNLVSVRKDGEVVTTTFANEVKRGDLEFIKVKEGTNRRVSVPFKVTLFADEARNKVMEEHVIVTDENGQFSTTSNAHDSKTNANDDLLTKKTITSADVTKAIANKSGTWFGMGEFGTLAPVDNTKGALPYGFYSIEEMACDNNKNLGLIKFDFVVKQDKKVVNLGTVVDIPMNIHTNAYDKRTGTRTGIANKKTTLVDTVSYSGLTVGKEYELKGSPYDKATGKVITDKKGNPIVVTKKFIAPSRDGKVTIEFEIDSSELSGKAVVIGETLYEEGRECVIHFDLEDEDQTVYFPRIHTMATDVNTKDHTSKSGKTTYKDEVFYDKLVVGNTYELTGVFHDKATKKPVIIDGKILTATKTFVPKTTKGSVILEFEVDASKLAGKRIVAFETVKENGKEIVVEANIDNTDQMIKIPSLHTNAKDAKTNSKTATIGQTTFIDTANYTNLVVGKKYKAVGYLYNKATGEKLLDRNGNPYRSEKEFVAKKANGTFELKFEIDTTIYQGQDIVVGESVLNENSIEVISHTDMKDEAQTIRVPEKPHVPETGDANKFAPSIIALAIACVGSILVVLVNRKKRS